MTVSTLDTAPRPATVGRGAASNAELSHAPRYSAIGQALKRASQPGYFAWLDHVRPAAGCTRPIRLHGEILTVDAATGQLLSTVRTADLPDGRDLQSRAATAAPSVCPVLRPHLPARRLPAHPRRPRRRQRRPRDGRHASGRVRSPSPPPASAPSTPDRHQHT